MATWRLCFNPPQFARRLLRLPCASRRLHRLRVLRKRITRDRDRHRPRRTRAAAAGGAECSSEAWIQRAGMCRGGAPLRKETVVEESLAGCSSCAASYEYDAFAWVQTEDMPACTFSSAPRRAFSTSHRMHSACQHYCRSSHRMRMACQRYFRSSYRMRMACQSF